MSSLPTSPFICIFIIQKEDFVHAFHMLCYIFRSTRVAPSYEIIDPLLSNYCGLRNWLSCLSKFINYEWSSEIWFYPANVRFNKLGAPSLEDIIYLMFQYGSVRCEAGTNGFPYLQLPYLRAQSAECTALARTLNSAGCCSVETLDIGKINSRSPSFLTMTERSSDLPFHPRSLRFDI